VAARLVEAGAPLPALAFQLFRQRPRGSALVWSKALGTLQLDANGRIASIEITRATNEAAGPGADSGGLSGFASSIEGVVVGFTLEEGDDGNVYVSLRSATVDVASIAAQFGGGGHVRAAGCHFAPPATLADARAQLLPAIVAALQ
jgi:bifunctional oligoribonuclease and PAP phosphatase NrnA